MSANKTMEQVRNDLLLQHLSLEKGIIPISLMGEERDAAMASLSPEEQRVAKRKYRKLWRKAAKSKKASKADKRKLGFGAGSRTPNVNNPAAGAPPTDVQRAYRKSEVYINLYMKVLEIVGKIKGKDEDVPEPSPW